jgi:type II secretory pathway pseudopilin PulG
MSKQAKFVRRGGKGFTRRLSGGLARHPFGGFTIIELLTVMSIIIILISLLVPALNRTRIFAKKVLQKSQFHEMSKGLELYRNDHQDTYPDSGAVDSNGDGYCGAMKLCEALLGQDGMGFHPSSSFQAAQPLTYLFNPYHCVPRDPGVTAYTTTEAANLRERTKYIDAEGIKAIPLQYLYVWDISAGVPFYPPPTGTGAFKNTMPDYPDSVIGDVFLRANIKGGTTPPGCPDRVGQKVGMPVLYFKADTSKLNHDTLTSPVAGTPNQNIYNFDDNYAITALGCPWEGVKGITEHPMYKPDPPGPLLFLKAITNTKIAATPRPHNEDGYILMSAGWDGLYGTRDDVFNFVD